MARVSLPYRKALVTGASSGLGHAFAAMLLKEGIPVVGISRRPEVDFGCGGYFPVAVDLADLEVLPEQLERVFAAHPEIDLVINNAGFGHLAPLENLTPEAVRAQLAVMLAAPTLLAGRAIRAFQAHGRVACLVNVSSLAAELPLPLMPVYNACKGGLSALSDSLLLDAAAASSCRVIDFRPGDFNTAFAERMEGRCDWNGVDLREVMDRHHAAAPSVELAVPVLRRALVRGVSGRVRVGTFFQAKLAPLGTRLLPSRWLRAAIRFYYRS